MHAALPSNTAPAPLSDLRAGLVAAVVALPQSLPLGILAFAPLGPSYAAAGAVAGLVASIVAGIAAALAGGAPIQAVGPRASVALVFASVLGGLRALLPEAEPSTLLTLALLSMLLGGALQTLFGLLRLGRLINYVPRPVVAGFLNGVALAVLLSQTWPLLGLEAGDALTAAQPASLLAGLSGLVVAQLWPRRMVAVHPLLAGLVAGTAVYHLLLGWLGAAALGPMIGPVPAALPTPAPLFDMLALPTGTIMAALATMMAGAAVLALVASVDSLMSAAALDVMLGRRSDPDRELTAHGIANMAAAACGGLPVTGSLVRSLAAARAGARSRLMPVAHSLILLAGLLAAAPLLAFLPLPVFAGVMIAVGLGARDVWSLQLAGKLLGGHVRNREVLLTAGIVVLVAGTLVTTDVMLAVAVGVLVSVLQFVSRMSKPVLRRVCDGRARRSLRVRLAAERNHLDAMAERLAVVELEGPLFFGTADAMAVQVEGLAPPAALVVLDLHRMTALDVTGGQALGRLAERLRRRGATLLLGGIAWASERGRLLHEIGVDAMIPTEHWFADTDGALEHAEDWLLQDAAAQRHTVPLAETALLVDCAADEVAVLDGLLETRHVPGGTTLFREGDADQALYLLTAGRITIRLRLSERRDRRLATYDPGVFFGEMALLQGLPRSADAVADHDSVLRVLTPDAFAALCRDHPPLALKVMRNMATETANRLRISTDQVRAAYA